MFCWGRFFPCALRVISHWLYFLSFSVFSQLVGSKKVGSWCRPVQIAGEDSQFLQLMVSRLKSLSHAAGLKIHHLIMACRDTLYVASVITVAASNIWKGGVRQTDRQTDGGGQCRGHRTYFNYLNTSLLGHTFLIDSEVISVFTYFLQFECFPVLSYWSLKQIDMSEYNTHFKVPLCVMYPCMFSCEKSKGLRSIACIP